MKSRQFYRSKRIMSVLEKAIDSGSESKTMRTQAQAVSFADGYPGSSSAATLTLNNVTLMSGSGSENENGTTAAAAALVVSCDNYDPETSGVANLTLENVALMSESGANIKTMAPASETSTVDLECLVAVTPGDVIFNELVLATETEFQNKVNITNTYVEDLNPGTSNNDSLVNQEDFQEDGNDFSDDSVNDPDYNPRSKKTSNKRFSFDSDGSEFLLDDHLLEPTFFSEVQQQPPIVTSSDKSIFVATYPDTIVFANLEEASRYVPPARFSAMYPGPIYDLIKPTQITEKDTQAKIIKNKLKHPLIQKTCFGKCRRNCNFLTEKERKDIWNDYWNMSYCLRRHYLNKCIKINNVNQKTTLFENVDKKHIKNESRRYYFYHSGNDVNVCKTFFLQTLGYKTDGVITELSRAIKRKPLFEEVKENRGGKKPKLSRTLIRDHIMSYNPALSHYRRHNAPLTRYLPRTLTLQSMVSDYKAKNPNSKCSLETYRQVMKQMKVSLKFPKGDTCVDCGIFEEKIKNGDDSVALTDEYVSHKNKAEKAIIIYKQDGACEITATSRVYSMDLQKVTLLPDMPKIKDSFFLSRLVAFNLTFAPLVKNSGIASKCVVWHEALMGRDANNIVDALVTLFQSDRDIKNYIIWCDNCTSQNKNWFLFTALVIIVNSCFDIETITLKYLTKGHTHMSADGVHGNIERDFKRRNGVYDFDDYKDIIAHCRNNITVLDVQNSYEWTKKKRVARRHVKEDPLNNFLLGSVVEAKFIKGSRNLFYKTDFEEPLKELNFLTKNFDVTQLPPVSNSMSRGVKSSKKNGIVLKLVPLMPISRRDFWLNLPVNDRSLDLVSDGQIIISDE